MKMLAAVFLFWIASCGTLFSQVVVGSDKQDVLDEWGRPENQLTIGSKVTFIYADGREVNFESGKVVNVTATLILKNKRAVTAGQSTVSPAPAQPSRQPVTKTKSTTPEQSKAAPPKPQPPPVEMAKPNVDAPAPPPPIPPAADIKALVQQIGSDNQSTRANAESTLMAMGKPAAPALIEYYRNPDSPLKGKKMAVGMVGKLLGPEAADTFIADLADKNCAVPLEVVNLLMPMKDKRAVEPLMRLLETADYSPDLRISISKALGEIGDPKALNMLISRFRLDGHEMVQNEMAYAMDKITGQQHFYNAAARLEWLEKNHPEWLEAGPDTFKEKKGTHNKIAFMYGGGFALGLILIVWFWKRH